MTPKLMSYNQIDFQSKFHLEAEIKRIENTVDTMKQQFKKAGLLSFTVTQIWNSKEITDWAYIILTKTKRPLLHVKNYLMVFQRMKIIPQ